MSIFKDCDIRGVYGRDLDDETGHRLGRALGARLQGRAIVVGGDLRVSTPALKGALVRGLIESGAQVRDLGQVPTPTLYFAKRQLDSFGAVMVTASHNPARYNGFKVMLGDLPVTPEDIRGLEQDMAQGISGRGVGTVEPFDALTPYLTALRSRFGVLPSRRVVVDAGNGSLSQVAPAALRAAGQDVVELYCLPDGTFPHRDPNPAVPEHLTALQERVVATSAELGIAYDGDGDRVIFVDGRARVQPADRTLVLYVRHLLRGAPGERVVYDLKSSSVVEEAVRAVGGLPLRERSGHAYIKRRLLTEDAVLAGELSGHYFFRELGGDDALYAALLMLELLDDAGMPFAKAMDTVPAYPITPDIRIPCPPGRARAIIAELSAALADYPQDRLDGVRIDFRDGWALARLSVTEPLITLRFEARTAERLEELRHAVREASSTLRDVWQDG